MQAPRFWLSMCLMQVAAWESGVDSTLVIIGVDHTTAAVPVRERFWISGFRRAQALNQLLNAEGIEEISILGNCERTEFLLWADEPALAANSVLRFLSAQYDLQLCEWSHFYRLLDEAALVHMYRLASGLDSVLLSGGEIGASIQEAWNDSKRALASGRCLDALFRNALSVAKKFRRETNGGDESGIFWRAIQETIRRLFGSLGERKIVILGAGGMGESALRKLADQGVGSIRILNRTFEHAVDLANRVAGTAVPVEDLEREVEEADIVIGAASSPDRLLTREQVARIMTRRKRRPLCLVDLAVPRDFDPSIRELAGTFLYDLDDLEKAIKQLIPGQAIAVTNADAGLESEARQFQRKLVAEHIVPAAIAFREPLDKLCEQELETFRRECGPFSKNEEKSLHLLTSRLAQRIAAVLAHEIREIPEKSAQQDVTLAVQKLFRIRETETETTGSPH